jgi:hypothetical protein
LPSLFRSKTTTTHASSKDRNPFGGRGVTRHLMRSDTERVSKMCEEYNGWTNRETWATSLWLNNEQALQEQVTDQAREASNLGVFADYIEEMISDLFDENWEGLKAMRNDIGSLYRVNWIELAESFMSEVENN